jgi:hypothetical protein
MEVIREPVPVIAPGFYNDRGIITPFEFRIVWFGFYLCFTGIPVNQFKIAYKLLLIFTGCIFNRVTNLAYNADQDCSIRENTLDGADKSGQLIRTDDKDKLPLSGIVSLKGGITGNRLLHF